MIESRHGLRVLRVDGVGPPLEGSDSLLDSAISGHAELVVIPVARLHDDFFDLATGVAGAFVQRFANYRIRLAIVGDPQARRPSSGALTAWIAESNRGDQLAFADSLDALDHRLRAERRRRTGEIVPYPGRKV